MIYADYVLSKGPVLYLPLDEESGTVAFDRSGNGLNGTYVASPTLAVPGPGGSKAVLFNGTSQYVSVLDNNLLDPGDTFTLEIWANVNLLTALLQTLFGKGANSYQLLIDLAGALVLYKSGVAPIVTSTQTVIVGSWYHVVVTKTGATVKIYINGVDVTGVIANQTIAANASNLAVGSTGISQHVSGSINRAAIYSTVLTPSEVLIHSSVGSVESTKASDPQHRMYLKGHKNRYGAVDE